MSSRKRSLAVSQQKQDPSLYQCPLTIQFMKTPVCVQDGRVYEKNAWIKYCNTKKGKGKIKSPMTNQMIDREYWANFTYHSQVDALVKSKQFSEEDCAAWNKMQKELQKWADLEKEASNGVVYASMSVGCGYLFGVNYHNADVQVNYHSALRFLKDVVNKEPRNSTAIRLYALALHATNSVKNNQEALAMMSQASILGDHKANKAMTSIFGSGSPISYIAIEEYAIERRLSHFPTNAVLEFDSVMLIADKKMMADFPKAYAQAVEDEANEDNEDSDSDEEENESDDSDEENSEGENSEEENDGVVNEVLS